MEQKKRGIKPGQKLTDAHRQAISRGRMGKFKGSENPNYREDRTQIKSGTCSFKVPLDLKQWLNEQPNKSEYIVNLIRQDYEKKEKGNNVSL